MPKEPSPWHLHLKGYGKVSVFEPGAGYVPAGKFGGYGEPAAFVLNAHRQLALILLKDQLFLNRKGKIYLKAVVVRVRNVDILLKEHIIRITVLPPSVVP